MTRFRKWLIHKLGGFTKEDIDKQPIKYNVVNIELETISAFYSFGELLMRNFSEEQIKKIVEEELIRKLSKGIKPEFIIEDNYIGGKTFKAKIELPSKYIKGVEDYD